MKYLTWICSLFCSGQNKFTEMNHMYSSSSCLVQLTTGRTHEHNSRSQLIAFLCFHPSHNGLFPLFLEKRLSWCLSLILAFYSSLVIHIFESQILGGTKGPSLPFHTAHDLRPSWLFPEIKCFQEGLDREKWVMGRRELWGSGCGAMSHSIDHLYFHWL